MRSGRCRMALEGLWDAWAATEKKSYSTTSRLDHIVIISQNLRSHAYENVCIYVCVFVLLQLIV